MENSEFKPVKLHLKIDVVSYPAQAEGLVNRVSEHNSVAGVPAYLQWYHTQYLHSF